MAKYRIEQDKDITRWTNDDIKVEFSEPYIQASGERTNISMSKHIMYFYYTVEVYHKNDAEEWELLLNKYVYDFPAVFALAEMLKECLEEGKNNLSCRDNWVDDYYELEYLISQDRPLYSLTIGGTPDGRYHSILKSVVIEHLTKEELESFQKFVNEFLTYAMSEYNKQAEERLAFGRSNKVIRDGKLYISEKTRHGIVLDSVLIPGDTIRDLDVYRSSKEGDCVYQEELGDFMIEELNEEAQSIVLDDGTEWKLSDVCYAFMQEPTDKLHYGIPEITQDFIGIMSDSEKDEFKSNDVEALFQKYCWLIVCRSWMCRNEHAFEEKYPDLLTIEDTGNHERVFEVVKRAIAAIKEKLK